MITLPSGSMKRADLRRVWLLAWQKERERLAMTPLETMLADVLRLHPEYLELLEDPDALARDWTPEGGQVNPFMHMGLHVALREGVAADRPAGLRELYRHMHRSRDPHAVDHALMDCLAETLWEAERAGLPPDEAMFLARAQRVAGC
ncbi:MAG: DUF1841 family protein [Gammaproteobacteria bacterium]|nr:DUF1841 family protein [Gammaproteobacteria bacterium]